MRDLIIEAFDSVIRREIAEGTTFARKSPSAAPIGPASRYGSCAAKSPRCKRIAELEQTDA